MKSMYIRYYIVGSKYEMLPLTLFNQMYSNYTGMYLKYKITGAEGFKFKVNENFKSS